MRFPLSHPRSPRVLVFASLLAGTLAAFCGTAQAQQQERKLMDRIERPDMNLRYDAKKNFFGAKSYGGAGSANVKEFYFPQKFRAKDFLTGNYSGGKNFWMGDFKYATKDARGVAAVTGQKNSTAAAKTFDTKSMPVKSAYDSDKNYTSSTFATRQWSGRGKSQDKIDLEGEGALSSIHDGDFKQLKTVEDVRQLLNKNK